jgi:hypothetical protein
MMTVRKKGMWSEEIYIYRPIMDLKKWKEKEKKRECDEYICVYIYIYIHMHLYKQRERTHKSNLS